MKYFLNQIKAELRATMGWTRKEANAAMFLVPLTFFLFTLPTIYKFWIQSSYSYEATDLHELDSLWVEINLKEKVQYFYFDPNQIDEEELLKLGLDQKLAKTVINFRNKGGHFYQKDDLKKIYGMNDEQYELLSPWIRIKSDFDKRKSRRKKESYIAKKESVDNYQAIRPIYSAFDPNELNLKQAESMGIPPKLYKRIEKYQSKGGKFYVKNDLKKIYGFPDTLYKQLSPWIILPDSIKRSKSKLIRRFDVNLASVEDLKQIRGIGESRAKSIINYRKMLGGSYHSLDQIREAWGMNDDIVDSLSKYAYLKEEHIVKIKINFISKDELSKHPYISFKEANWICKYRKQHGVYTSVEDLYNIKPLTQETIMRMAPYLDFSK